MTLEVCLRPEAERDLLEAASWYEEQQSGLGHRFLDEALKAFAAIAEKPSLYPIVHRNTRRLLIHRFPFGVYYRVEVEVVVVIAIMHGSRDPRTWQRRV
jgi:plasmid stabilization system protein ParE